MSGTYPEIARANPYLVAKSNATIATQRQDADCSFVTPRSASVGVVSETRFF